MEQAAVDDVVEALAPVLERQGIFDEEDNGEPPFGCLAFGPLDGLFEEVDAGDSKPSTGKEQSRVTRSATGVEDGAADPVGRVDEGLLRLADVQRRLACVQGFKGRPVGYGGHEIGPLRFVVASRGILAEATRLVANDVCGVRGTPDTSRTGNRLESR